MFHGPSFIVSTMQAGTTPIFNVFGMTGPSTNREANPQILLVGESVDLLEVVLPHPGPTGLTAGSQVLLTGPR